MIHFCLWNKSWHLQLKFDTLLKVNEVEIAASRGQDPGEKKNWSKILKSAIFELTKRYTPQEKAKNNCIQIWNKKRGFCNIKVGKYWFCDFRSPQKTKFFIGLSWISGKPVKIVKNYLLVGTFMDKVKNFCDFIMILWEMAALPLGYFWVNSRFLKFSN